jgi:hypothetical protein
MNWFKKYIYHPPYAHRLYWGWVMFALGIMMAVLMLIMLSRHRYGVAAWDAMCVLIDFFCAWIHWAIYAEWIKNGKKPLTTS